MKNLLKCLAFLGIIFLIGCQSEDNNEVERPYAPWVFRSVLDSMPRMVTVALHDDLWAAYSAQDGSLYKAWKGYVNLDGAVYTTSHGPQPTTVGDSWYQNEIPKPWVITKDGNPLAYQTVYKGHRFENGQVYIKTNIITDAGTIRFEERPEYVTNESGQTGFERTFYTADVPEGVTVTYNMNVSSIALMSNIYSDAVEEGNIESIITNNKSRESKGLSTLDAMVALPLTANGATNFVTYFAKEPVVANLRYTATEEELKLPLGQRLIERSDCKSCHNTLQKTVGPSYMAIAERYPTTTSSIDMLTKKVIKGGGGNWGDAVMSAHGDLPPDDVRAMVEYILGLDKDDEGGESTLEAIAEADYKNPVEVDGNDMLPGCLVKAYVSKKPLFLLKDINWESTPDYGGSLPTIEIEPSNFKGVVDNFGLSAEGYLNIEEAGSYVFRLSSDDGSSLSIHGEELILHDGLHGTTPMEGAIGLKEGLHPFRIEFFNGLGGKALFFEYKKFDEKTFTIVPQTMMNHSRKAREVVADLDMPVSKNESVPGDGSALATVHPSFDLSQARPNTFLPKVGGMDFLEDGRLVVCTWEPSGSVHIIDNVSSGDPSSMTVTTIASGLAEPLGLKVVDNEIYILQKQELTRLVDNDGDEMIDEYQTVSNNWKVSSNFHEFAFGLAYKDGYFYGTLATAILPGGASANPQIPDRGKVVKISKADGSVEFVAHGLRTPNGIGIGTDDEIFVADNQGDWLPASKIVHVRKDAWFGSRSVDFEGTANLKETLPVVWLPQDEIGNSPSTPMYLNDGPYKGQMIHGEVTNGGIKRVFVEKVNGEYQGALFRFVQGLEAGVNRIVWGPDGALYVGGIGNPGNWGHSGKLWYGLQRLKYNEQSTFEMLAVRAKSNGVEIELTEPLREGDGWNPNDYTVQQWYYKPTPAYGGPKMDERNLNIKSVNISEDRKKIFLELDGMKENHVVYVKLHPFVSENGGEIWTTEAWYTMNTIPVDMPGFSRSVDESFAPNTLTAYEKAAGWKLLFDGKTLDGWRNFRKETIGSSWKVNNGAIMLDVVARDDGGWQAKDGGDIITDGEYQNFELSLEWKIQDCGNSGIIYNVHESEEYDYVWQTGPEMQVLDNSCHPDARFKTHRAGDLYDMIECKYVTVRPAGEWNQARIIINNGKAEHWLNGRKVVEFTMFDESWTERIANSKFKDMKGFGTYQKGHISLQDHGDRVWYRNIKVRELK